MPSNFWRSKLVAVFACLVVPIVTVFAEQTQGASPAAPNDQPTMQDWGDDFDGEKLDEKKWEQFTFEGGAGRVEVKDGQLRQRGMSGSRAGVISKPTFSADRFVVEARLAKVGAAMPEPGQKAAPLGFGTVAIMFDGSGRNRIEWILTSEGTFEAWSVVDGRGERLDNRKLGTKIKNPVLAIVRRQDNFLFVLNGPDSPPQDAQIGLQKTIKNMPHTFRVMLYGFGASENNWDSLRVTTAK